MHRQNLEPQICMHLQQLYMIRMKNWINQFWIKHRSLYLIFCWISWWRRNKKEKYQAWVKSTKLGDDHYPKVAYMNFPIIDGGKNEILKEICNIMHFQNWEGSSEIWKLKTSGTYYPALILRQHKLPWASQKRKKNRKDK